MVDATIRVVPRNDLSSLADERFFISLCGAVLQGVQGTESSCRGLGCPQKPSPVTVEQGVQGDGVLLPGSGERCLGDSVKGPQ